MTKNDRENFVNGNINWTEIEDEEHTVALQTDKGLYGFHLKEYPRPGSLSIPGFTVLSGSNASPSAGRVVVSYGTRTGWVWCSEDDNAETLSCTYEGGGWVNNEENLGEIVTESPTFEAAVEAAVDAALQDIPRLNFALTQFSVANSGVDADHDLTLTAHLPDGTTESLTKRCDAAAAWAQGDGGSLIYDTTAIPMSGYIKIYAITDGTDIDYIGRINSVALPTLPSGWTFVSIQPIEWLTDSSANLRVMTHARGKMIPGYALDLDLNALATGSTRTARTAVNAPAEVVADLRLQKATDADSIKVEATAHADQAPSNSAGALSDIGATGSQDYNNYSIYIDSSRQYATDGSGDGATIYLQIYAWATRAPWR
jgi:hypothetical protein